MAEYIILGLIQGITEFLPISSSGHLIIVREFMGLSLQNTLTFDVFLHLSTLLAIIIYFWGDVRRIFIDLKTNGLSARSNKLIWAIILGSIPAAFFGFFWGNQIEDIFRNSHYVSYSLIAGSLLFFLADNIQKIIPRFYTGPKGISAIRGFFIGIFQSLALISGFSRSGSTISGGLVCSLSRQEAIKFSFLLGVPTIFGAALKTFIDSGFSFFSSFDISIVFGFLVALVSGLFAVRFLVRYLSNHSFTPFIIYRLILAGIILFFV
jgi:undecaprenyl-diphosphatase